MNVGRPKEHECDHILVVEGYSDLHFYAEFLNHLGRLRGVFIQEFKSKSEILSRATLSVYLGSRLRTKKSIGILVDADNDPAGAVEAVAGHLQDIAGRRVEEGVWSSKDGEARLGFLVVPSPHQVGELETLVWDALPDTATHRSIKKLVDGFHSAMAAEGEQWRSKSPSKGRIGAYLSAAYDEDPRLGPGARAGKFPFDAPGFDRLRRFLEELPVVC